MKQESEHILDKFPKKDGLTVPDGFFDDFARRMAAELPLRPELEKPAPAQRRTVWHTVRPYVSMAAMFTGVWCMLSLVTRMSGGTDKLSIAASPELATAVSNESFVEDYIIDNLSGYDLYDSMAADSLDMENLSDSLESLEEEVPAEEAPAVEDPNAPLLPQ